MAPSNPSNLDPDSEIQLLRARIAELENERQASRAAGEQSVRQVEERFRVAQELSPDGFMILHPERDADGRVTDFTWAYENAAAARMNGTNPDLIVGRRLLETFPGGKGTPFFEAYWQVAETGKPAVVEASYQGETITSRAWFRVAVVRTGEDLAVLVQDITDRKRAEEALRESEEKYRTPFESIDQGFCTIEVLFDENDRPVDYRFLTVNPAFERQTGIRNAAGKRMREIAPLHEEHWFELYGRIAVTGEPVRFENSAAQLSRYYEVYAFRFGAPAERKVAVLFNDITERRKAETALRESEARFRQLFESMIEGYCVIEMIFDNNGAPVDFLYLRTNPAFERQATRPMLGKRIREMVPDFEQFWLEHYGRVALTGEPVQLEHIVAGLGNQWFRTSAFRVGGEGSREVAVLFENITARKQAEQAVRESEERLRLAQDAAGIGAFEWNVQTGVNTWTPRLEQMYGLPAGAFGRTQTAWEDLLHPEDREVAVARVKQAFETGSPGEAEFRVIWPDGSIHWLQGRWQVFRDASGAPLRLTGIQLDITDRKRAEEALRGAMQRLDAHIDNSPLAIIEFDPGFRVTRWSNEAERMFGWKREEILGRAISEIRWVLEEDAEIVRQISQDMLDGKRPTNLSVNRNYRKDGSLIECEWYNSAIYDARGELASILSQVLNVTERKRAEEALRNSRKQLQDIIDGSPGVVFARDLEGRFITANRAFEQFLGTSLGELKSKADDELIPRELAESYREHDRRVAETGKPVQVEEVADLADGRHFFLANKFPLREAGGKIYGVCTISTDITERKQQEERLRQSQKLESIGLLAGGVAHDFNNLLVGVIGNASMAQDLLPPDSPAAELLQGVLKAGEQAAHLTRQMLAYSGKGKFVIEALDLSAVVRDLIELVRPSIPKSVLLTLDLGENLPSIEADRGQVQQVLMNLAINAAEAIGSVDGLITVRTRSQTVDHKYRRPHEGVAGLPEGEYVVLEVRDSGCGMDETTQARIFDPFFSTKFTGRGLGLAAVAGIMRGHKGAIVVTSAPGKGATFTALFPATTRGADAFRGGAPKPVGQGSGTVLVIDDELVVRSVARGALERYGYTVLVAESGAEAIDLLKRHPGKIDLAILDLSMPGMSGEETFTQLRKIRPELRVFVSSGYGESEAMSLFTGQRVAGFLQKPYTSGTLAEAVKRALG